MTAAVIDLIRHKALREEIEDVRVSRSRRHEKRIPLHKVRADLIKSGKLRGLLSRRIDGERRESTPAHPHLAQRAIRAACAII